MSSTASATLATWFKIKGVNYSISSACATSNHCIGNAYEIIQLGKQDVIFAGRAARSWTGPLGPLRRHGRDVVALQRPPRDRLARLRP
jgi:acetyl-CoA acetyltransferase